VGSSVKMSPLALGTAAAAAARPIGARFTQAMRLCTSAEPTLRKGFNLFEVLGRLPSQGAGARVYRRTWEEKGYSPETHHWLVTRSMLRMKGEFERGKVWGELIWKGQPTGRVKRIPSACKREWEAAPPP